MRTRLRPLARRAVARAFALGTEGRDGLRILTYHRVNGTHPRDRLSVRPDAFAAQMELLARSGRPVIPLAQAPALLHGEGPRARGAVAITFDDGFADNFEVALPILGRFGFPATFFIATGYVGSDRTLDRYRDCCADDPVLSWDEVRGLRDRGHEIGGHGRTHRELGALAPEDARAEIDGCALDIEASTGTRPRLFCYPRGSETPDTRRLVAETGFLAACTVRPGANHAGDDLLGLARTEVSGDDDAEDFRLKLAGGFDGWHRLRQRVHAWRGRTAHEER